MASNEYMIPWKPLDISPGAAFITSIMNQNRQNDRADEYVAMQREAMRNSAERASHEAERDKEREEYKRRIEAFNAMPALMRAASTSFKATRSPGYAANNPYGVSFDARETPADQTKADAEVTSFLNAPPQAPKPPPHQLAPGEEGPVYQPTTDELMEQATTGATMDVMSQAAANSFGPPTRKLTASFQGQQFDVPEMSDKTPFGAEYDVIYRGLVEAGEQPHDAMKIVATQFKADQTQANIARRTAENTAALISGRDTAREDEQAFRLQQDAKYKRTFEEAMSLARAAAARLDPTGGTPPEIMAVLADYAIKNPGDQPGLYREAARLNTPMAGKAVTSITSTTKPTESQARDAKQAAIGIRAIESIQKSNYVPDRATIQKWLDNQRDVYQATQAGEGGGIGGFIGAKVAGAMQKTGLMAQSEVEGLSPQAANYFANVRRFMETIGRAQSGAAISQSEWINFFNQYGPNSPGGLEAAKQYMAEQLRASGVAGRSIAPGAGSGIRTVLMPDGTTQKFDASGKRVE